MTISKISNIALAALLFTSLSWSVGYAQVTGQAAVPAYKIETIEIPEGLSAETGAMQFMPDGRLIACFHRGEVMTYSVITKQWKVFATGLHDPLGILPISNTEILLMQRPELTRIKDTNGDGVADEYLTVTNKFGLSGNYHEFGFGPVKDKDGNLFIALNTASNQAGISKEPRGQIDSSQLRNRMFSAVPYRGWVMKLTPGGELIPYASGFRSPNGLLIDQNNNLFVTDNQGDWLGTSTLYHVKEGKFYGHVGSLAWTKGWNRGNPALLPVAELDKMRTRATVLFPNGPMANSPTQPVQDLTNGKFGPFAGQIFVGEMNRSRLMRVMLEEVNGVMQGAVTPFIDDYGLRKGNNRLVFAPDGSLWVGQNDHGWAGDKGIQRITYTGAMPTDIYKMTITSKGFDLTFTQPLNNETAANPLSYSFKHYFYEYHAAYGSNQFDVTPIKVTNVALSSDKKTVSLTLEQLKPGYIYELNLIGITAQNGAPLQNKLICYTVNQLRN